LRVTSRGLGDVYKRQVLYGAGCKNLQTRPTGRLADVAPTLLALMGLPKPAEMTGESLIAG
jgi:2,3-bisphosphoglycerate-independent phosphoglycerate mutase